MEFANKKNNINGINEISNNVSEKLRNNTDDKKKNFLLQLENKYGISNLVNIIQNRSDRCCLERILGCLFSTENTNLIKRQSLFGNIMTHQKWCDYNYEKYIFNLKKGIIPNAVVKIWTGR